jgi:hypothetical protein
MEDNGKILAEIKHILARLVGTEGLPTEMQFSEKALDKAAIEFKKLRKESDAWVKSHETGDYIQGAWGNVGDFIKTEFNFTNFYYRGPACYYYKKDLINLSKELKKRNIDLKTYMELKAEKTRIEKSIDKYPMLKKKIIQGGFKIPDELSNIRAPKVNLPTLKELNESMEILKKEFTDFNLSEHIDLEGDSFAMLKNIFYQGMSDETRKRVKRWLRNFNTINYQILERNKKNKKK